MKAAGLENVETLLGGYAAWQQAGLPVETGSNK
jgi:3-mercaptopyruvate sulfurtransferase SseA